jgi:hypothetical protein
MSDPYEPIFLNDDQSEGSSSPVNPIKFIDDESLRTDRTWSSARISQEVNRLTENQFAPGNAGLPGQLLYIDGLSKPMWTNLINVARTLTAEEIDEILANHAKGLSSNDFTDYHKETLEKIESGRDMEVSSGTLFINRTIAGGGT